MKNINTDKYSISVIVPVYNEIKLLEDSLRQINNFLSRNFHDFEIIVIESASTDGSSEICDKLANEIAMLRAIHEGARRGFGSALKIGYAKAQKDLVWLVTVDFPFPLEAIFQALPLFSKYDCVLSYRLSNNRPLLSKARSVCYNLLVKTMLGLPVRHVNSAFKVFKKEIIQNMELNSCGWFIDAEIIFNLKAKKIPFIEIPVPLIGRPKYIKSSIGFLAFIGVIKELICFLQYRQAKVGERKCHM